MGWTDPRTWVTDELVTAAIMNTHVRDNLNSLQHLVARKTADESVTSSSVLQDDNHLILPVLANEVWQATWYLLWNAGTAGDIKIAFTFPSAGTVQAACAWFNVSGTITAFHSYSTTSPSPVIQMAGEGGTDVIGPVPVTMVYVGGANAGNVTLQWAQNTSDATATIMKTNSTLWAAKLA